MNQLSVENLGVRFGNVAAVSNFSFTVNKGTLVGLIGSNGAGKTTALDALTGFVPATGSALFEGRELLHLAPHKRAGLGLGRTWQSVELFDDLTVYENICVAATATSFGEVLRTTVSRRRSQDRQRVDQILVDLDLADVHDRYPEGLSEGERKFVGLARTLVSRPKLMLADEPAAGLDSDESRRLGTRLRGLVDDGLTILLVDHDMGMVLEICDLVYVLDHGVLIATGTPDEIRNDSAVLAAYLGGPPSDPSEPSPLSSVQRTAS